MEAEYEGNRKTEPHATTRKQDGWVKRLFTRKNITLIITILFLLCNLGSSLAEGGGTIAFSVSCGNGSLAAGDLMSVNVRLDTAVASFGGTVLNLTYDSSKLEYVKGTPLIGTEVSSEEEAENANGDGIMVMINNQPDTETPANSLVKLLLLNSGGATGSGEAGLAAAALANIVFRIKTGASAPTVSLAVDQIYACDENTTDLSGSLSTDYTTYPNTVGVTVATDPAYPASADPEIYILKTADAGGTVTVTLKAVNAAKVQRVRLSIRYPGYTYNADLTGINSGVTDDAGNKILSIDYSSDDGYDVSAASGVFAAFTLAPVDGASSSDNIVVPSSPAPALAYYLSDGSLSATMQPLLSDDPYGGYALGDVTGNGTIDISDAVMVLQSVARIITLNDFQSARADVAANGTVDISDAVKMLQYVARIITEF